MTTLALYEEASDDWIRVDATMTSLVGGSAMRPGNLLWLDDGKRYLVGDVNWHFGTSAHCRFPCIPIVRAWRRLINVENLRATPQSGWATAFDHDEDPFDFIEEEEYPQLAEMVMPANTIGELDLSGALKPGMYVGMEDGRTLLVGHVNVFAGVCDSQIDGNGSEGQDHRIVKYLRVVSDDIFSQRQYRP